jgi:hypothetical protein
MLYMKQLNKQFLIILSGFIFIISLASAQTLSHKSDNKNKQEGYLQHSLDNWLKKEWNPATKSEDYQTKNRFKLQDYIDKAALYMKANSSDKNSSNIKRLESMPVIGKSKK